MFSQERERAFEYAHKTVVGWNIHTMEIYVRTVRLSGIHLQTKTEFYGLGPFLLYISPQTCQYEQMRNKQVQKTFCPRKDNITLQFSFRKSEFLWLKWLWSYGEIVTLPWKTAFLCLVTVPLCGLKFLPRWRDEFRLWRRRPLPIILSQKLSIYFPLLSKVIRGLSISILGGQFASQMGWKLDFRLVPNVARRVTMWQDGFGRKCPSKKVKVYVKGRSIGMNISLTENAWNYRRGVSNLPPDCQ